MIDDATFFREHPGRLHRVRPATADEIELMGVIDPHLFPFAVLRKDDQVFLMTWSIEKYGMPPTDEESAAWSWLRNLAKVVTPERWQLAQPRRWRFVMWRARRQDRRPVAG